VVRFKPIPRDGDGHTHLAFSLLDVHNLSPAPEANRLVRIHILKHQGQLDWRTRGKQAIGYEEHMADTDFSGNARLVIQFHEQLNPKALHLRPA